MLSYKLYTILKDIIENTYPEKDFPENKFTKFFIELNPKEMKSIHGRYYIKEKKIEVVNLSRPTGHIVTTSIHEASHHIDQCLRNDTDHTKEFYTVMQKLLVTAMGMGIISQDDILTASDNKDRDRLVKYFGAIESWGVTPIEYNQNSVTIKVTKCFEIKDKLKARGYSYSGIEQAWVKEIDNEVLEVEKSYLAKIIDMASVEVISGNELNIQAVYYILVLNSYEHKDYLKQQGYLWNGYNIKKNSWNKKILANEKDEELKKIAHLPGIEIKIATPKGAGHKKADATKKEGDKKHGKNK